MPLIERIWSGEDRALEPVRMALAPLGEIYAAAMWLRRRLYRAGAFRVVDPDLPVVSVGNLTVGGTGKTPVAAWIASRLRERAQPAVLLRGYGRDEIAVHERLNPGVPVIATPRRAEGVRAARDRGADVVVADDAFQHLSLGRTADIVLLSAEQLGRRRRALPAGPWRERLGAARAADLVVVTRKTAPASSSAAVAEELRGTLGRPVATVHLAAGELVGLQGGPARALESLRGRDVLAVAAIGEPGIFADQLRGAGARVRLAAYRDHHHFTPSDVALLGARIPPRGMAVCTLKDAVKLASLWPPSSPLWYVSQRLVVEEGTEELNRLLDRVLAARTGTTTTPASPAPASRTNGN